MDLRSAEQVSASEPARRDRLGELAASPKAQFVAPRSIEEQFRALAAVRRSKEEIAALEKSLHTSWQGVSLPASLGWAAGLTSNAERADFVRYLGNHLRLLKVREQILSDRFSHACKSSSNDLQGIDLAAAKNLHIEVVRQLSESESTLQKLAHFKDSLNEEDFELAGLSTILQDPFSLEVVKKSKRAFDAAQR